MLEKEKKIEGHCKDKMRSSIRRIVTIYAICRFERKIALTQKEQKNAKLARNHVAQKSVTSCLRKLVGKLKKSGLKGFFSKSQKDLLPRKITSSLFDVLFTRKVEVNRT